VSTVQIPSNAVSQGTDLQEPVVSLLHALSLLGSPKEMDAARGPGAVVGGPPQSVALIEAGATAGSKWWAAGFGTSAVAAWASVAKWVGGQPEGIKAVALGGAFFVTAAAVVAIGHLFAADVRGRAAAAVATIGARERLAAAMLNVAEAVSSGGAAAPAAVAEGAQWLALSPRLVVRNVVVPAENEEGWHAVALGVGNDGAVKYLVVKGTDEAVLGHSQLEFA
jgi:hypothetical protein